MKRGHTAAALLAATAGLATARYAAAQPDAPLSWNNAAGGSASTTSNWAPNQMPAAADDLTFNLLATYTVTFNNLVPSARTHTYRRGTVNLATTSPHAVSTGITIGDTNALIGTMTLATGTLDSASSVVVGSISGSSGILNVNDDSADLIISGAGADLTVGLGGSGTMSISNGGLIQVADQFVAGANASSVSDLNISGAQVSSPFQRSRLLVQGTSQSRFGQGGDATVDISNGAIAQFAGSLVVSNGSASVSTVTLAGAGGIANVDATLLVQGDLLLGRNISVGAAAGTATMNVNGDGSLLVDGTIFVAGDPEGGTATLHMASQGVITTNSLNIGTGSTLDLDGGALTIDGGTFSNSNTAVAPTIGGINHPVVTLENGASSTLSVVGSRALTVGGGPGTNLADFDLRSGSDLTVASGDVIIGSDVDDTGSMIINGVGSTMTMPAGEVLVVGQSGDGRYEAELGGAVSGDQVFIAQNPGSTGGVLIESPGTTAGYRQIFVGGQAAAAGGAGNLSVNAQAVLNMSGSSSIIKVWPLGNFDISGGGIVNALNTPIDVFGDMVFQNQGVVHAFATIVGNGGRIQGHPNIPGSATFDSPVSLLSGASLELINGDLTVGRATSSTGFAAQSGSTIDVGAHTLTLLDSTGAVVDTVTLAGGTLAAPNGIDILNGGSIDGTGIIDGDVSFNSGGSVITATTAAGITIQGMLTNNSGSIDGTKFTFTTAGAGWTGAGAINAKAQFDAGTIIDAVANMTIGDASTTGATFNGTIHLNTGNDLTINDSNGCALGTLTDMDGGDLTSVNGLVVNTGRTLRGHGDIDVSNGALTVFGTIEPDVFFPGTQTFESVAEFDVIGNYTQGAGSHYNCEVAGLGSEFDQLRDLIDATGVASLNGAIHISFALGYTGVASHVFDVVEGSSRVGTFSQVTAPSVPFGPIHVVYLADRARVVMCYANCDGSGFTPVITANDFTCFINRFASGDAYANCDGSTVSPVLTANDFQCFINKVANGCP
jgi:T5SS/PEP-CTERM-associated repeat protein